MQTALPKLKDLLYLCGGYVWRMIRSARLFILLLLVLGCTATPVSRTQADWMLQSVADADSRFIDERDDSLILPAVTYYRRHGPRKSYAWSLYYLGRLRFNAEDYNGAILAFAQAAETRLSKGDPSFRGFVHAGMADTYRRCFYDTEALRHDSLALSSFRAAGDPHYENGALYNLALQHYNMHHRDTAAALFRFLSHVPDTMVAWNARRSLAALTLYRPDPDPEESCRLFEGLARAGYDFYPREIGEWAYACELAGQHDRADSLLGTISLTGDLARYGHLVATARGDTEAALNYLIETDAYDDSLHTALQRHSIQTSMEEYQAEAARRAQDRARIRKLLIYFLAALMLALVSLSGWMMSRQRRLHAEREKRLEFIAGESRRLLQMAQAENTSMRSAVEAGMQHFVVSFRREWAVLADLCREYHATYEDPEARNLIYNKVMDLASAIGRDDKSFRRLEKRINEDLDGLMLDFRRDFAGRLPEPKFRLAAYLVAGFDASLIALLLDWKDLQMVYREKNRLLNKVSLSTSPRKSRYLIALK